MTASETRAVAVRRSRGARIALVALVAVLFAVVYAYYLAQAIGSAILLPQVVHDYYRLSVSTLGWVVLVLDIAAAPVMFAAALLLGIRRGPLRLALLLATGLTALAAVTLTLENAQSFINVVS